MSGITRRRPDVTTASSSSSSPPPSPSSSAPVQAAASRLTSASLSLLKCIALPYVCVICLLYTCQSSLIFMGVDKETSLATTPRLASLTQHHPHLRIITNARRCRRHRSDCVVRENDGNDVEIDNGDGDTAPFRYVAATALPHGRHGGAATTCVILFFGGNGENIYSLIFRGDEFARYACAVVAVEMPGYGPPSTSPGPLGVASWQAAATAAGRRAQAVVASLQQQQQQQSSSTTTTARSTSIPLIVVGSSIGTFSAAHVFARGVGDRLLLHAPLPSLVDVAAHAYWFVPVRALLKFDYRFDNMNAMHRIRRRLRRRRSDDAVGGGGGDDGGDRDADGMCTRASRVMIVHGTDDAIVPLSFGRRVFAALIGETNDQDADDGVDNDDDGGHNEPPLYHHTFTHFSGNKQPWRQQRRASGRQRQRVRIEQAAHACFVHVHGRRHNDVDMSVVGTLGRMLDDFFFGEGKGTN